MSQWLCQRKYHQRNGCNQRWEEQFITHFTCIFLQCSLRFTRNHPLCVWLCSQSNDKTNFHGEQHAAQLLNNAVTLPTSSRYSSATSMDSSGGGGNSLARLASFFGERNPFGGNFTWREDLTVLHYIYTHHFAYTVNWKTFELKIFHKKKIRVKNFSQFRVGQENALA